MRKISFIIIGILIFIVFNFAYAWEGETHEGITNRVLGSEILDIYFINIGYSQGENTLFTLLDSLLSETPDFKDRVEKGYIKEKSRSALAWLVEGSVEEDAPLPRASNHFHDPTTLDGLDNLDDPHLPWAMRPYAKGESARKWAFIDSEMEFRWSGDDQNNVRKYFYKALTSQTEQERNHYWALTLFGLGSVIHLLEDMSVPEHVRNDWYFN